MTAIDRHLRQYAWLMGYEPKGAQYLRAIGMTFAFLFDLAIIYAVVKVLFFHDLPVWP